MGSELKVELSATGAFQLVMQASVGGMDKAALGIKRLRLDVVSIDLALARFDTYTSTWLARSACRQLSEVLSRV